MHVASHCRHPLAIQLDGKWPSGGGLQGGLMDRNDTVRGTSRQEQEAQGRFFRAAHCIMVKAETEAVATDKLDTFVARARVPGARLGGAEMIRRVLASALCSLVGALGFSASRAGDISSNLVESVLKSELSRSSAQISLAKLGMQWD